MCVCVFTCTEGNGVKEGERGLVALLTLYKLDSRTSGTSQQKAYFEETSLLASLILSSSHSRGIQSPSVCHH